MTANPPLTLMRLAMTAARARPDLAVKVGSISNIPPTTMIPLTALVTLMRGVWSAGVTEETVK